MSGVIILLTDVWASKMFKRLKAGFNALVILFPVLSTWNFEHMILTGLTLLSLNENWSLEGKMNKPQLLASHHGNYVPCLPTHVFPLILKNTTNNVGLIWTYILELLITILRSLWTLQGSFSPLFYPYICKKSVLFVSATITYRMSNS